MKKKKIMLRVTKILYSLDDEELRNLDNAMEGLDIIYENINSSIETKTELMDQDDREHD